MGPSWTTLPAPSVRTRSPGCGRAGRKVSGISERGGICRVGPALIEALGKALAGDAVDGSFAGGIDIEHRDGVGGGEGRSELIEEQLRAGIAVRLEDDMNAAKTALASGGEGGADLGGMVAVVVDNGDAVHAALELKAAVDPVVFCQAIPDFFDRDVESDADGDGSGGVANVVFAGNV